MQYVGVHVCGCQSNPSEPVSTKRSWALTAAVITRSWTVWPVLLQEPEHSSTVLKAAERSVLYRAHVDLILTMQTHKGEWEDSGGWQLHFLTDHGLISKASQGLSFWDLSLSAWWQLDNAALIQTPSCAPLDLLEALRADCLNDTHILNDFRFLTVKASYFCRSSPCSII